MFKHGTGIYKKYFTYIYFQAKTQHFKMYQKTNFVFSILKTALFLNVYHNLEGKELVIMWWCHLGNMVLQVQEIILLWNKGILPYKNDFESDPEYNKLRNCHFILTSNKLNKLKNQLLLYPVRLQGKLLTSKLESSTDKYKEP